MYKVALLVEYDGTRYKGFQLQRVFPTIQGELEEALFKLFGERVKVRGASRTDAGVHALGQVVSLLPPKEMPPNKIKDALNFYLPRDIKVRASSEIPYDFDVRKAKSRTYKYIILNRRVPSPIWGRFSHLVRERLDFDSMKRASSLLVGKRDFSSFTTPDYPFSRVREVYRASLKRKGDFIIFEMEASSFLPQQVRRTMGALLEVGLGKKRIGDFEKLVRGEGEASLVLPPNGLFLVSIKYKEEIFNEDGFPEGREEMAPC